ncbi:hypothetical protein ACEWY4_004919 [Coilia grayii]|uniref:Hsp90 co-chaperone Cdc37-like 1 n=1 Tax=Coilia grayii TaxID=363190 RepID=A0ABD1KMX5_9TELE
MEWQGTGASNSMCPVDDKCSGGSNEFQHLSTSPVPHGAGAESMESLVQRQQCCVKASIASRWRLAEAQDQLCGLELHGSESSEQERARTLASSAELCHTEQQWRLKESMLGNADPRRSPELSASRDVFDKSIINVRSSIQCMDQDKSKTFVQKHESQIKHFGMLRRWDDSQRFLSQHPHLICEAAANYLILWCFRLQAEGKEALMEQVAHQAVALQFILEMGSSAQQDPRACFRHFFHKAKVGQEGYLDVFHGELEAFKRRVREYTMTTTLENPNAPELQNPPSRCRLDPKEVLESLPPELKAGLQLQDMQILQNVLSTMSPQVAEHHVRRCLEAGLWTNAECVFKDDATEADDFRMMET